MAHVLIMRRWVEDGVELAHARCECGWGFSAYIPEAAYLLAAEHRIHVRLAVGSERKIDGPFQPTEVLQ